MFKKAANDKVNPFGFVERRLFSREKFYNILTSEGVLFFDSWEDHTLTSLYEKGVEKFGKAYTNKLLDKAAKPQFKENFLWKYIKKHFDKDIAIPFLTGFYTLAPIKDNLIVTVGHQAVAQQLGGTTTTPMTAIAIGTGTTAAAAGDTALQTEITTGGGARGAATVSNVTVTNTGDTEQWVKTFNFTSSFAVTEEGILSNNVSGGTLLSHQVFSAVNVANGDSLQITHKVTC